MAIHSQQSAYFTKVIDANKQLAMPVIFKCLVKKNSKATKPNLAQHFNLQQHDIQSVLVNYLFVFHSTSIRNFLLKQRANWHVVVVSAMGRQE